MKLPKEIWMCENEQARWYEYEQPYDLPNDVTVTKMVPAQSEQEPVAYINIEERKLEWAYKYMSWGTPTVINLPKIPLYTTPPQRTWIGLTDEEIVGCATGLIVGGMEFAKAIETKLKDKNNGS